LGTDEETIYSVFGRLANRIQISELTLAYKVKYERDLLGDLLK
jgi:hypothetical protein